MPQILTVGQGQQFPSIQHAVNYIETIVSNSTSGLLSDSYTIEVYPGVYGGFIINPSMAGASSSNRLTIKTKPNADVTLSGFINNPLLGHGYNTIGIGIGDNNPYITIKGFKIENFLKGIVLGAACRNSIITQNLIRLNRNVGLWVYRSEYCQVINNVILDHDNGLVISEINDVLIAHNDVVNITSTSSSQSHRYNLHITTKNTNTYTPNGTIILYNNNIVSAGGSLIGYGDNVLTKLRSDNNNLYNPGGNIATAINPVSLVPDVQDVGSWQTISNNDHGSISIPSDYYIGTQVGASLFTSITLSNYILYGGIAKAQNLCNALTAANASTFIPHGQLPSYVDTSLLCETIQSNFSSTQGTTSYTRPNIPSIGAYDISYDPFGFASSLVVPLGSQGSGIDNPDCKGGIFNSINTIEEKFDQSVECIHPSIVAGFFYIHDIQHYLYSCKVAHKLSDITCTDFILGSEIRNVKSDGTNGIKVLLGDQEIPLNNYKIIGTTFRLYHRGLDLEDFDKQVSIIGTRLKWKYNTFAYETYRQTFRIRDGDHHYVLPYIPTRAAPIVITDDMINYQDSISLLGREFTTALNKLENKVDIEFAGGLNLLENPQFDYIDYESTGLYRNYTGYTASNWITVGNQQSVVVNELVTTTDNITAVLSSGRLNSNQTIDGNPGAWIFNTGYVYTNTATGSVNLYPVIGSNFCLLSSGLSSDGIKQRVKVNPNESYWLTFYSATIKDTGSTITNITGNVNLQWRWYDINHKELRNIDEFTGSLSVSTVSNYKIRSGLWSRHALAFSNYKDQTLNKADPSGIYLHNSMVSNPIVMPSGTFYMDISIGTTGYVALDCVSFVNTIDLPFYTRRIRGNEATIEYDTGTSELYTPYDLTITPIRNLNSAGFLYIGAVPAQQYDSYAEENTTTITDWGWATGRLNYLPWARTSGKNKLRHRANFNINIQGSEEDISINSKIAYPDELQIIPRIPIANLRDGFGQINYTHNSGNGIYGKEFTVRVTDTNGNPYAFENITLTLDGNLQGVLQNNYPGLLSIKELGFYTQYNTTVSSRLDSAGSIVCKWMPPGADDPLIETTRPANLQQVTLDGKPYYELPLSNYNINSAGMGNPFMSSPLNPYGYQVTGNTFVEDILSPSIINIGQNNIRGYRLSEVPHRETLNVWINKTGLYPYASGQTISGNTFNYLDTYDLLLQQSEIPEISNGYYFVDEPKKIVFIAYNGATKDYNHTAYIRYKPRTIFLSADDQGIINNRQYYITRELRRSLINDISDYNPLSISYDINIDMIIKAHSPTGMSIETRDIVSTMSLTGKMPVNIREKTMNVTLLGKAIPRRIDI